MSRLGQETGKRKLFIYSTTCDGDVTDCKRKKTNPHTGTGPAVAEARLESFVKEFYRGDMEPRPESQADDVLIVLCKIDNSKMARQNNLDKVRAVLRTALSKRHLTVAVGSVEPTGEDNMTRFRRVRRALGAHIEDKAGLMQICNPIQTENRADFNSRNTLSLNFESGGRHFCGWAPEGRLVHQLQPQLCDSTSTSTANSTSEHQPQLNLDSMSTRLNFNFHGNSNLNLRLHLMFVDRNLNLNHNATSTSA